jgi:hypothetical protein
MSPGRDESLADTEILDRFGLPHRTQRVMSTFMAFVSAARPNVS